MHVGTPVVIVVALLITEPSGQVSPALFSPFYDTKMQKFLILLIFFLFCPPALLGQEFESTPIQLISHDMPTGLLQTNRDNKRYYHFHTIEVYDINDVKYEVYFVSGKMHDASIYPCPCRVYVFTVFVKHDPTGPGGTAQPYSYAESNILLKNGVLFCGDIFNPIRPANGDFQRIITSVFESKENLFAFMEIWNTEMDWSGYTSCYVGTQRHTPVVHKFDMAMERTRDTDGDGVCDWDEVFGGSDYLDTASTPDNPGGNNGGSEGGKPVDTSKMELLLTVLVFVSCLSFGAALWKVFSSSAWR